jgi:hypothetical protein
MCAKPRPTKLAPIPARIGRAREHRAKSPPACGHRAVAQRAGVALKHPGWQHRDGACTARGLRRTFQDLARAASVESLVQKSISGHSTDAMKDHYSTVNAAEQRTSIARVVDLMEYRRAVDAASPAALPAGGAPSGAPPAEVVLSRRKADHARA